MNGLAHNSKFILNNSRVQRFVFISSSKSNARSIIALPMKLRVFTENFYKNIPSFRFPLKISASTLPHTSYNLPFYFDHAHFLSYRVQAFAREVLLNREQRKHFIGYDLGVKQHLHLSGHSFINFKRFSSFGTVFYEKSTLIHFFRTLNQKAGLYLPFNYFVGGSYVKSSGSLIVPAWHIDPLADIFKKRVHFNRKLRVQNDDVDMIISGSQVG
jgi:hypothetical protein